MALHSPCFSVFLLGRGTPCIPKRCSEKMPWCKREIIAAKIQSRVGISENKGIKNDKT